VNKQSAVRGKPSRLGSTEEILYLALLRTGDMLSRAVDQLLKTEDLSSNQYNVLRILRGEPGGLACGKIGSRMITRDPDITRLLDRLERRGLISRWRDSTDRRTVMARITAGGLKLLTSLDEPIRRLHSKQLGHLSRERQHELARLLSLARASVGDEKS